jgi:hypothetical protein
VISPSGASLIATCTYIDPVDNEEKERPCFPTDETYYANAVRHAPEPALSVLAMPSNPDIPLETGVYYVIAQAFRPDGKVANTIPKITAVVRMGSGGSLDLHLHFLDLADHPCEAAFNGTQLTAASAANQAFFRDDFLGELRTIFTRGGISFGSITYHDITTAPELDGLDVANASSLLALGKHERGINVFFVRTLSPVGLQAFGPNPGPAGLARTRRSGIVIGVDTLCYRSWTELARLTAHEIARYMGLYHNVETNPAWQDPIGDSNPSPANLMFYSELNKGTELSTGQLDILTRSPVLR